MSLSFLSPELLNAARQPGLPRLDLRMLGGAPARRGFLAAACSLPLTCFGQSLVFEAPGGKDEPAINGPRPDSGPRLKLGEIPDDFWLRPRVLRLYREATKEHQAITYWRDGKLDPTGYWAACALLRDVQANKMTAMDPLVLDIMRGMLGYYEAWKWPYPLVIRSGFRTLETNNKLLTEGAAWNSLHLYGRAVDLNVPGIPIRDVGKLAQYFQRGGVGFYANKLFVHIDTGTVRAWNGDARRPQR